MRSRLYWIGGILVGIFILLFVASFFLDSILRARLERAMNERLTSYHTRLAKAHLWLFNGNLVLRDLTIVQDAHPKPPVANFPVMSISIQWRELFSGRIVADCLLRRPVVRFDLTQLRKENADKVPLKDKGWQQALQSLYPFKINRFRIRDGDITYIDIDPKRPLHLANLEFNADNIRNIHAPERAYPSAFHASAVVFEKGHTVIDGHANFLCEPTASFLGNYELTQVPLEQFAPEVKRANFKLDGGVLESKGMFEYAPSVKRVQVYDATLNGVHVEYFHLAQTAATEEQHKEKAKETAKEVTNKPGVLIKVDRLHLLHTYAGFENNAKSPGYKLFFTDMNVRITNLSNQFSEGDSKLDLHGRFMGSGDTKLIGAFRPEKKGADLDLNLAIENSDLTALNGLLRTYGRFDVKAGNVSIYSQMTVRQGELTGYVKPLFSNLEIYNHEKDKDKPLLQQAKQLIIAGAAKLFKNHATKNVATDVNLSGKLDQPNVSRWQAFLKILENAFINAILPGFDRQVKEANTPAK